MTVATMTRHLVNLFYPLHCPACKRPLDPAGETLVCEACASRIRRNPAPDRSASDPTLQACAVCVYDDILKELIHTFKFNKKEALAPFFAGIMAGFVRENPGTIEGVNLITWVPLDSRRLRERSFNQSELIAREVGRLLTLPAVNTLTKATKTRHQNELTRDERLTNVRGSFATRPVDLKGRIILVIDDVMTTGATLGEARRALVAAGAAEVRCLALARGL